MTQLLFIGVLLIVAVSAPLHVLIALVATLLLASAVAATTARWVAGMDISLGSAAKGVSLALTFVGMAAVAMFGYALVNEGGLTLTTLPLLAVLLGVLVAYVMGFQIALGLSFVGSALVALASTGATALVWNVVKRFAA